MTELLLLDVSPLLALAWPNHPFHAASRRRLESRAQWATCALTQLAFIRLSLNPAIVGASKNAAEMAALLAALTSDPRHRYLADLPAPTSDPFRKHFTPVSGHQQVTDAYLLALAAHHSAKLLTFDTRLAALTRNPTLVEVLAG
jgi:toxin-antitoxin system PIN domain toxin